MVDCENRVRLDAYHDGELSPAERSDVEAHLRDCPSCAAEVAAMRRMSGAVADTAPRKPSHEQLLQLARSVRAEPQSDTRMLLRLFRGTAVAATVLLSCALAAAAYQSQRTRAAAHEVMVLDHLATGSQSGLAQWIADDLRGRQEER